MSQSIVPEGISEINRMEVQKSVSDQGPVGAATPTGRTISTLPNLELFCGSLAMELTYSIIYCWSKFTVPYLLLLHASTD